MGRKIILILSILCLITAIGLLIWTATGMNTDIFSFLDGKKTTTCTRQYSENGNNITDVMKITYNKNVLKVEDTNKTIYKDANTAEISYQFSQLLINAFNGIDGINVNYTKDNDNTITFTYTFDYQQLNEEQLKTLAENNLLEDSYYSKKNITFDEFKNQYLTDYICE